MHCCITIMMYHVPSSINSNTLYQCDDALTLSPWAELYPTMILILRPTLCILLLLLVEVKNLENSVCP